MPFKTILVNLNAPRRAADLLGVAASVAEDHSAHLIALHVVPDVFVPATVPVEVTGELIEAQQKADAEVAAKVEAEFRRFTAGLRITSEWRKEQARFESVAEVVMRHGRTADLLVVGQSEQKLDVFSGIDVSEEIVLRSGRPVLMVPLKGHNGPIGKKVLLAWKDSREATRATFDSLPFLMAADSVQILSVRTPKKAKGLERPSIPAAEIATCLSRHDVRCEIIEMQGDDHAVSDIILNRVRDGGIDLVVMGGYGHSRLREVVLGGATRSMFDTMTVPVLLSH